MLGYWQPIEAISQYSYDIFVLFVKKWINVVALHWNPVILIKNISREYLSCTYSKYNNSYNLQTKGSFNSNV